MTDRQFLSRFRRAMELTQQQKNASWTKLYVTQGVALIDPLASAIPKAEHAEAAWHKDAGSKIAFFDVAEERYRHWANHVKADVHGADLGEFIADYHSVAGFDDALGKMIDAFEHYVAPKHPSKKHDGASLPYAAEAHAELEKNKAQVDEVILATRGTWQAFRDAAAAKNALKAQASEIFKAVRRHLKTDLGETEDVKALQTPARHARPAVSKTASPPADAPAPTAKA